MFLFSCFVVFTFLKPYAGQETLQQHIELQDFISFIVLSFAVCNETYVSCHPVKDLEMKSTDFAFQQTVHYEILKISNSRNDSISKEIIAVQYS